MYKDISAGMSLIELMVAILIISILAAVSGSVYTSYTTKSRFAEVFANVNEYKNDLEVAYTDNDQFPTTFSNLTSATYTSVSSAVLQQIYYGISSSGGSAYLYFFTNNLGASGYVAANSSGSGGVSCRITLAAIPTSTGDMRFYCGQWDGSSEDVPLTYLPQGCQDTNISALIS